MTKTVSQLDQDGCFVGTVVVDPDPLEPGRWLIPARAVDAPAPDMSGEPPGRARWTGTDWAFKPDPEPDPEPEDPEPLPVTRVSMRQARLALLELGYLPSVDAAIDSLPEPQKSAAKIEWEYSQEVDRDWVLVKSLAPALGLDDAALDSLFALAASK